MDSYEKQPVEPLINKILEAKKSESFDLGDHYATILRIINHNPMIRIIELAYKLDVPFDDLLLLLRHRWKRRS